MNPLSPAISSVTPIPRGFETGLDQIPGERVRVEVLRDDIIRIKISHDGFFEESPTFAVCVNPGEASGKFTVTDEGAHAHLTTPKLSVTLCKIPFSIVIRRADGSLVASGAQGSPWYCALPGGGFEASRRCGHGDAFYGLGEKTGRFNRRGRDFTLWNSDVLNPNVSGGYRETPGDDPLKDPASTLFDPYYISIPFFYHHPEDEDGMAGFFFDNGYRGRFEFSSPGEYRVRFDGGQYTEYIFAGPDMAGILGAYTWLTGRMSAPPIWALGNHQCRWHDYDQRQVAALGRRIRDEKIPCDVVWLDIDYMDGFRVFTWDAGRFPDPEALMRELKEIGLRVITIIDPGVKREPGYPVFDEALRRNLLCKTTDGGIYIGQVWPGETAFPDFTKEETRQWWGALNAAHVRSGVAGIWNDMNEPATGDVPDTGMLFGDGRFPHGRFHNQYALLMAMGTVAGLLEAMPEKRTFVLSRAGSAGIQRFAANWLGDNVSRWDHLWMAMPMALGLGVSGQPFVGADVGGFVGTCSPELLARWYQYAAFTPFCRNHNATKQPDQYAWAFDEETTRLCREALELRYRLLPAIYSEFIRSTETGLPVQRPLVLEFQDDPAVRVIDDQFLLGPNLLVAPVCEAGATGRSVYLPRGTWHEWHTGDILRGSCHVDTAAPLGRIPFYARGGSVVPCWPHAPQSTMDHHPEEIELHIFTPGEDGEWQSMLQEDDGLTYNFRAGAFLRTEFTLTRAGGRLSMRASVIGRGYPEFARRRFILHFHGLDALSVTIDGKEYPLSGNTVTLPNTGTGFELSAEISAPAALPLPMS